MKIVEIEYTPNPNAVKFILDQPLTSWGVHAEFHSAQEAESVPLAQKIFAIPHIHALYWTDRWVTVTQDGEASWHDLLREVAAPIREATIEDVRLGGELEERLRAGAEVDDPEALGLNDERLPAIREVLEEEILPFLQGDGGGLEIKGLVDNQLFIRYQGACGTCPSASMGTLLAIENLIQMEVDPEIVVVNIDGPADGFSMW